MMKRILSGLLALLMVVSILPVPTFAEETDYSGNVTGTAKFNPENNTESEGVVTTYGRVYVTDDPTLGLNMDLDYTLSLEGQMEQTFVIDDYYSNGSGYWYKLAAQEGETLPKKLASMPWVYQNDIPSGTYPDALVVTPPQPAPTEPTQPSQPENPCGCCENCTGAEGCECQCGECTFCEKKEEPTQPSQPENSCKCCEDCTGAEGCECQCGDCAFCEKEEEPTQPSQPENSCKCCEDCAEAEGCQCECASCAFKKDQGALIDEDEPEQNPLVGRLVKLIAADTYRVRQNPADWGVFVGAGAFPAVMKINGVSQTESELLYQLVAADKYTWPTAPDGNIYEGYYLDSTKLELIEEAPEEPENPCGCCDHCTGAEGCECLCGQCDFCEKEPENSCECCEDCTGAEGCECQCGECDFCQKEEKPSQPSQPENTCKCCDDCTGAVGCECQCGECTFCEKEEEPSEPVYTDKETGVVVELESIVEGVKLKVSDADVSTQLSDFGVSADKLVFGLDISLSIDGEDYQTDATIKLPVSAPEGTKIGILHTHEGKTSAIALTEVQSDGTIEFKTDGFSEFAGFTVDFHYNDIGYSIGGLTSITLSELFVALEIDRDAARVIDVTFSDTSLVSVTKIEGDWVLESLRAFQTEETLEIVFVDGEVISIRVTDASWATDKIWGRDAELYYYKTDNNWGINTNRVDFYFYLYDSSVPGDSGKTQANYTHMDRVYKNRTATLCITDQGKDKYWFYGTSSNLSLNDDYFTFNVSIGSSDGTVTVERIPREIYRHTDYQLVTINQKRYAGTSAAQRTVKILLNGEELTDATTTKYFPNRGASVAASQLDIQYIPSSKFFYGDYSNLEECGKDSNTNYVDTSGKYYSYSGGDFGTYTIPIYTKFNVVFDGNGATSGSMSNQAFIWGKPQALNANQYSRSYTVTYNANGGTCNTANATATYGFAGWAESATGEKVYNNSQSNIKNLTDKPGGNHQLYAKWTPTSVTLPAPNNRAGYTFLGWSDGTSTYAAGASYTPTANVTLIAQWEPLSYTINYRSNGGTGTMSAQTVQFDSDVTIRANGYTAPKGHQFVGWTTDNTNYTDDGYGWTGWSGKWTYVDGQYGINDQTLNLYARWTKKTFTVNYHSNGGSGNMASHSVLYGNTIQIQNNGFVAPPGKHFAGWAVTATGTAGEHGWSTADKTGWSGTWNYDNGQYGIANNTLNLYAIWEDNEYTVTWKNGNTTLETDTVTHGGSATYNGSEPAKTAAGGYSYTFSGWDKGTNGTVSNVTANTTVTAQFSSAPIGYTATFNYNGGDIGETTKSFNVTSTLTLPQLTRTGYTGKWKVTAVAGNWTMGTEHDAQSSITGKYGDVIFTAQWTPKTDATYTVHYYVENSSEKVQDDKVVPGQTFNQVYTETAPGTIGSYILVGSNTQSVTAGYSNNEITFYYKLNQFSVSYSYTGTIPAGAPAVPAATTETVGSSVTVTNPTLTGYTFSGWVADGITLTDGVFTMPNRAVAFTGSWSADRYTITYDLAGGTRPADVTAETQTYTIEQAVTLMDAPTKTGYKFTGWKLDAAAGNWEDTDYTAGQQMGTGKHGDIKLVAQWGQQYRYALKFDANDGSNPPETMIQEWCDDASKAFTWTTVPVRNGYTFAGWAEAKDSTVNVAGEDKNTYTLEGIPTQTKEKTLYAIWERQTGDLKLTFNGGETAPAIVTVSGQGLNITLVLTKAETIIRDLPTGTYNVTAESGSAQMTAPVVSNPSPDVKDGETTTVNITIASRGLNWFTAFYRVKNQCS